MLGPDFEGKKSHKITEVTPTQINIKLQIILVASTSQKIESIYHEQIKSYKLLKKYIWRQFWIVSMATVGVNDVI